MIAVGLTGTQLVIRPANGDLKPRDESQLAFWGFARDPDRTSFAANVVELSDLPRKLVAYLTKVGASFQVDDHVGALLETHNELRASLEAAIARCRRLKDGVIDPEAVSDFATYLSTSIARKLKDHQVKAALHLLAAGNGAIFSVPGSGKTTVVLAVFDKLKRLGEVDALFVVGPPACFGPWKCEYLEVLGHEASTEVLAGGDVENRRSRYLVNSGSPPDLFLTTFQTLQRDWEYVRDLFHKRGVRFYLVIDEAHYVKQIGGAWSSAVLNIAKHAARRCVLTGTPFPRSYADAFNLFDILWPDPSPISFQDRHRIMLHLQRSEQADAAAILQQTIGPLFYRVRKSDLGLAAQVFHEPIRVRMNTRERQVYDSIIERITFESQSDFFRDFELLVRLRKGRMIRLRQCTSYAALLSTAVPEYDENLLVDNQSLASTLRHYDDFETPGKIGALVDLVKQHYDRGEKVVVWSNFVRTLKLIVERVSAIGCRVGLIYGDTPFEASDVEDEASRETIIREFARTRGGHDVLVANPAACAESVSLHKACAHAIYYDLSYNCAQYLQSLDRIHRVGGSETRPAHYYVLQYEDTLDHDILANLRKKAASMSEVVDQEYAIYSMDMFGDDDGDLEAYERLFRKQR
jgi:SNF2 family DNA or RNA helicase